MLRSATAIFPSQDLILLFQTLTHRFKVIGYCCWGPLILKASDLILVNSYHSLIATYSYVLFPGLVGPCFVKLPCLDWLSKLSAPRVRFRDLVWLNIDLGYWFQVIASRCPSLHILSTSYLLPHVNSSSQPLISSFPQPLGLISFCFTKVHYWV